MIASLSGTLAVRDPAGTMLGSTAATALVRALNGAGSISAKGPSGPALSMPASIVSFEGLSNQDNANYFGFRVNPPDPVGDIGPNHYVEMVNLTFAVYDRQGNQLMGPVKIGDLWQNFAVPDCTDPSGDPIVLYDQLVGRWILSQFTTRGPKYYDCVAISMTGDPTGAYFRYAFDWGSKMNDYPKFGVWMDAYYMTVNQFLGNSWAGAGIAAFDRDKRGPAGRSCSRVSV